MFLEYIRGFVQGTEPLLRFVTIIHIPNSCFSKALSAASPLLANFVTIFNSVTTFYTKIAPIWDPEEFSWNKGVPIKILEQTTLSETMIQSITPHTLINVGIQIYTGYTESLSVYNDKAPSPVP